MKEYEPTSPHENLPARPVSSATSGPSVAGSSDGAGAAPPPPPASLPDSSARVTMAKQARWPQGRTTECSLNPSRHTPILALSTAVSNAPSRC